HHHLVCDVCGRIEDLHVEFPDVVIPSTDGAVGFEVTSTEIVFRGRCAACASSAQRSHQPNTGEQNA
ncbi:MAG: hypothetical protein ACRDJP_16185, partial [Actinomycetota bacterium]